MKTRIHSRPTAVDAVIIDSNRVLLIKRGHGPFKGCWALPGGFVKWNETVEQAVAREAKEETGLDAKIRKLLGVYSCPQRDPRRSIAVAFLLKVSGKAVGGDDAKEAKWFALSKLPRLSFDHKKIIGDAKQLLIK